MQNDEYEKKMITFILVSFYEIHNVGFFVLFLMLILENVANQINSNYTCKFVTGTLN